MASRREPTGGNQSSSNAPRQNVYFVPRDGIDREVITADICRYLGNDALVRPGTYQDPNTGQLMQGYHITAYRNLTSAMIQSLKEDSARWDTERRSRTAGSSSSRFSGAQGAAYPGSDAPGYSGGGSSGQAYQQQYDSRQQQQGYSSGQYAQGQQAYYPPQNQGGDRYAQPQGGAYPPSQAGYGYGGHSQAEAPYVNVGANHTAASSGYQQTQGQDPRYGYQGQQQVYAQPVDPMYGRGNQYPPTSQADYASAQQPVYQYDSQYQTAIPAQTPATHTAAHPAAHSATRPATQDPRATTSSPVSTQAQTGHSASQSTRHHRDREHRESSSRHSRRPN